MYALCLGLPKSSPNFVLTLLRDYRVFHNEWPKQNVLLQPEAIYLMMANGMQNKRCNTQKLPNLKYL